MLLLLSEIAHTYSVSICVQSFWHSINKPWKILVFQVLAKSFISVEGQIGIRWVGEKGRVGENICGASSVTGSRHKGWTLSARHWTHYTLILIASLKIWEGDPTSRSWNWEMSKNSRMDGASREGVARLRSSVSSKNSNIVNTHNVQYDKYNVQWINGYVKSSRQSDQRPLISIDKPKEIWGKKPTKHQTFLSFDGDMRHRNCKELFSLL